jgi:peptide/nickel transport system substrate-binding protein
VAAAGVLAVLLVIGVFADAAAQPRPASQAKPEGEMRWALYVTLSPLWFDPGEFAGLTPFWVLYAIHDALVKPMPGNLLTPSLAESWTVSADQLVYEFKLREGLKFHNGDPFTAEDVKFSFLRAKGSKILHDKVRDVVSSTLPRPLPAARGLAGLHDVLWNARERSELGGPEEVRREGRR